MGKLEQVNYQTLVDLQDQMAQQVKQVLQENQAQVALQEVQVQVVHQEQQVQ